VLRIGLLVDGTRLRWFDAELVRRLQAGGIAEVALVIQQELPHRSFAARVLRALKRGKAARAVAFRVAVWIERRLVGLRRPEIGELFRRVALETVCDTERLRLRPSVSPSGFVHRFSERDVRTVEAWKLDVILRMGSGILRGGILRAAAHGIVSFHHGDNRTHRGGPPGYWEVVQKRDTTGYIVQRLTEALDAGEVLARGEVATQPLYLLNQHRLFKCSISSMVDVLARLDRDGALAPAADAVDWYAGPLYSTPGVAGTLRYLLALLGRLLGRMARRAALKREVWELRLLHSDWRRLELSRSRALAPPRGRFWADPFVVRRAGATAIFFEEYEYARGKAHIAALVGTRDGGFDYAGPVVRTPHHLSFPFVFEYRGELYMCPESHQAREIQLWRCTAWPLEWRFETTLMRDIDACDTMLVERGGRWWLLANLDRDGAGDFCRELHVYHADSPLSQRWTALAGNPVVTGASRARNAGLLQRDGRLYRLAQAQGFDRYGAGLRLFEVTQLSESGYAERPLAVLEPARARGELGLHHLSASGDAVVFDVLRARRFWTALSAPAPFRPSARAAAAAPARAPRSSPTP